MSTVDYQAKEIVFEEDRVSELKPVNSANEPLMSMKKGSKQQVLRNPMSGSEPASKAGQRKT